MKKNGNLLWLLALALAVSLAQPMFAQRGRGGGQAPPASPPPAAKAREAAPPSRAPAPPQRGPSDAASRALEKSPELADKLRPLLPPGTSVLEAAQGFNSLGQFVSAVHISHNLGIPFPELKQELLSGSNLGQAIRKLKPGISEQELVREMRRAEEQAQADIKPRGDTQRTRERDREQDREQERQRQRQRQQ